MKKTIKIAFLLLFSSTVNATSEQQLVLESKQAIQQFSQQLKNRLQHGMLSGGPVAAIHVCNTAAEEISKQVSEQFGWKIARTSLKVRNDENTADGWERRVLRDFEKRKQNGVAIEQLEASLTLNPDTRPIFRYMKAIPTQTICLSCHGEKLPADVVKKLHELYPDDQATGFNIGDIRGAFTITRELKK